MLKRVEGPLCHSSGRIEVILGPMFSGKTTELIRRIRRHRCAHRRCVLVKYTKDDRYSAKLMATHDKCFESAFACVTLSSVRTQLESDDYQVIGIDEGQFFPDIAQFADDMANRGKVVIVAALDGTFLRQPFGSILDLVPKAESVMKLTAICQVCGVEAAFSRRIGTEMEVEVIGGADKYVAVCRECFNRPVLTDACIKLSPHMEPTEPEQSLQKPAKRAREMIESESEIE